MHGTLLIYSPDGSCDALPLSAPPTSDQIHDIVGGYIELVPYFDTVKHDGEVHVCRAFCNEDGHRLELPYNVLATALWAAAIDRRYDHRLHDPERLRGSIAVIFGDAELMRAL